MSKQSSVDKKDVQFQLGLRFVETYSHHNKEGMDYYRIRDIFKGIFAEGYITDS